MKQNGRNISYGEEDSLTYVASALQYDEGQLERATSGFENYATKFPDGKNALEAHYRLATIYDDKKDYTNAIRHYSDVAAKAPNRFAEQSVLQAARIYYFELKDYTNAEKYFNQLKSIATNNDNKLESMRGLLRCQFKLNEFAEAAPNAQDLLQQKGLATDDRMMANMVIAKNAQTNNQLPEALASYRAVVALGKSEISAEARYHIAEILFAQKKMSEAEKAAFDVINKAGSYNYWITKAYILLGDVYFAQKDYFNAEATLKSVVENATITELQQEAQQKLDAVVAEKNNNSKVLAPTKN
jgi:TolA-binding protein